MIPVPRRLFAGFLRRLVWCLLAAVLCSPNVALAANLTLDKSQPSVVMGKYFDVLEDPDGQYSFDRIEHSADLPWQKSDADVPNFGYSRSVWWFRTQVLPGKVERATWLLEVAYPLLDNVELFVVQDGRLASHDLTGDHQPFRARPIAHRNFLFPIGADTTRPFTLYLRTQTTGTLQVPATLYREARFVEIEQERLIPQAAYFGMLLVMLLYNLFILFSIRSISYFYYLVYVVMLMLVQLTLQGLGYQFLWPEDTWWQDKSMAVGASLIVLSVGLFSRSFLQLQRHFPRFVWIINALIAAAGISAVLSLVMPYATMIRIAVGLAMVVCSLAFISGLMAWRRRVPSAPYFVAAWGMFLTGALLLVFNKAGWLPRTWWSEYGMQFGSVLEVIVLSIALADRINVEKREKYMAQKRLLEEAQQRTAAESRLLYQSLHDALTGIPNRTQLSLAIPSLFEAVRNSGALGALVLVHFPQFHEINNTLGHQIGDALLHQAVQRLQSLARKQPGVMSFETQEDGSRNPLAHVEGVRFALFISAPDEDDIVAIADAISRGMREPTRYLDMSLDIATSVGIALYHTHGDDFDTLLRCAEVAVEVAAGGERQVAVYADSLNRYSQRRLSMMGELRRALDENQLTLYYQPQYDVRKREVVGVEALLRWNHAVHGFIPPDQFVTLAEHTGLIKPLTRWVLENAIHQVAAWHQQGLRLGLSVNVSARNLRESHFGERVLSLLERNGLEPGWLTVELTETAMMEDREAALKVLTPLHKAGVNVSIDDFGVGYSSLSYLNELPLAELKIDKSFIFALDTHPDDSAIVRTTINMAHDLNLTVVAEGVESEAVCGRLVALGCDIVQGYYIERPVPPDQLLDWLRRSSGLPSIRQRQAGLST